MITTIIELKEKSEQLKKELTDFTNERVKKFNEETGLTIHLNITYLECLPGKNANDLYGFIVAPNIL